MIPTVGSEYSEQEVKNHLSEQWTVLDQGVRLGKSTNGPFLLANIQRPRAFTYAEIVPGSCYFQTSSRFHWNISHELRQRMKPGDKQLFDYLREQRTINLLVQPEGKGVWLAAGSAELKGGQGENGIYYRYSFRIEPKMPHALWVAVGGYETWLVAVGRSERRVRVAEDLRASLTEWGQLDPYMFITRYEGDSLLAAVNERGMAALYYQREGIGMLYRNAEYSGASSESFSFGGSYDLEVTESSIIRRDQAENLIGRFVTTGDSAIFSLA